MGFLTTALIVGVVGVGVAWMIKDSLKESERKNTLCMFEDGVSQDEFNLIVEDTCKTISRVIDFKTKGPVVSGKIRSQSGVSEWSFEIDFNDYGHITGKYWISSKNNESKIPETIAQRIQVAIKEKLKE